MKRYRLALVAASVPLVALAGVANAQDRYPPTPTETQTPTTSVSDRETTRPGGTEVETLPPGDVNPPAGGGQPAGAPASDDALAATGADVALLGLSGAAALAAGGGAVYAARRRRQG